MQQPNFRPCTLEELFDVPASGFHYKPSRAKVVPIYTAAVQPTLVTIGGNAAGSTVKKTGGSENMSAAALLILGAGAVIICWYLYTEHQRQEKQEY